MSSNFMILVLCATIIHICWVVGDETKTDSPNNKFCKTPEKKDGQCIVIRECEALFKLIRVKPPSADDVTYLRKSHCGFNGTNPKVCCPNIEVDLEPGVELPGLNACGIFSEDRVINGEEAQLGGFPWLALLEYKKPLNTGFHCGGVLISSRYVLTAAHCISGNDMPSDWNLFSIRLGEHNRETDLDCEEIGNFKDCAAPVVDVAIETKVVHESYDPNDVNRYHDIALLRLSNPVKFSEFLNPICLPPASGIGTGVTRISAAGWGVTKDLTGKIVKQNAELSIKNNSDCQSAYEQHKRNIRDIQLCAVPIHFTKDSCTVDSGGPLMAASFQFPAVNYFVTGLMSYGPQTCFSREPLVYTNIYSYLPWIKRNLKP